MWSLNIFVLGCLGMFWSCFDVFWGYGILVLLGKGGYKCDGEKGRYVWYICVCFLMWLVCAVWISKW